MLTVRPAAMSDLDAMTDIEAQSFPPEEKATRESFEARMKVFPECFMLLCEDGRPVGLIDGMVTNDATISDPMFENASLHDPKGAWQSIFGFCVLPEMRGRGAAPLLMRAFIEKAAACAMRIGQTGQLRQFAVADVHRIRTARDERTARRRGNQIGR